MRNRRVASTAYRIYLLLIGAAVLAAVGALAFTHSMSGSTAVSSRAALPVPWATPAGHTRASGSTVHAAVTRPDPAATSPATVTQMASATSASPAATTSPAAAAAPSAAAPAAVAPAAATPAAVAPAESTTNVPVAAGSGPGCSSGVTDGNTWIKYTVRPGDNLSTIAACFDLNGYESLYQNNINVIGNNPNLIYPGEVILIVNGVMTVDPAS
jgi:nucleoid-associated protein YgaU